MGVPYATPALRARGSTQAGALHEGRPWRQVVHIETQTGERGGETWVLTLECGHRAFRPVPPFRFFERHGQAAAFAKIRTAPERVRCLWCESS